MMQKLQEMLSSSGAMSASRYANSKLDVHSYIAQGIRSLPAQYQPGTEWYRWVPGKSPLSTSECDCWLAGWLRTTRELEARQGKA